MVDCITNLRMFEISQHLSLHQGFFTVTIDGSMALCLLPLLEAPQSVSSLAERWRQVRPLNPVTLEPTGGEEAFYLIQQMLTWLESLGYVLLECQL